MTNHSNITEFPRHAEQTTVTLDQVAKAMNDWLSTKTSRQDPIPDNVWQQIIKLIDTFPEKTIRSVLVITPSQLRSKLTENAEGKHPKMGKAIEQPSIDFCEIDMDDKDSDTKFTPATNTVIVEFRRADGRIMSIHTTTHSFKELMKAFFAGE